MKKKSQSICDELIGLFKLHERMIKSFEPILKGIDPRIYCELITGAFN